MTKDELQEKAVEFIHQNTASLLELATGSGKTKTVLEAVDGKVLIVYKQKPHLTNWKLEEYKWNIQKDITYSTYNSLHKLHRTSWDYIVLDEAHAISDLRLDKLKDLTTKKWIFLSATVKVDKKNLLRQLTSFKTLKFNIEDAVNTGLLPPLDIRLVKVVLNNVDRNLKYIKTKSKATKTIHTTFDKRFEALKQKEANVSISCSEQEYYYMLCENIEYYKNQYFIGKQDWQKNRWLQLGSQRKSWLATLKTGTAKKLVDQFSNERLLVFAHNIDQCEQIAQGHPAVHSKNPNSQAAINDFNDGKTNLLFNVRVLNEGINLSSLDKSIIVALDGQTLPGIQRIGRSTRSEKPIIYIIVVANTKDEEYFHSLIKEINQPFNTITI